MSQGAESAIESIHTLTFRIFTWVAGADDEISPKQVDVYLRMLRNPSWGKSAWARANLPHAADLYTRLWKQHRAGELERSAAAIEQILQALRPKLDAEEAIAVAEDLRALGAAIARASGGFAGIGAISREEQDSLDALAAICAGTLERERSPDPRPEDGQAAATAAKAAPVPATDGSRAGGGSPQRAVWSKGPLIVRCVRVFEEARDTKTFRLVGKAPVQFHYTAGQSAVVEAVIDGKKVYRSYTIASSPSRPDCLELTVKRVPGGQVSNWLHDQLREGDEIVLSGPAGKFSCCFQRPAKILMVSAGSGVTPVMSMTRWLYDTGDAADITFLHSARAVDDLIFRDELELIARRHPGFRLVFTLTRDAPPDWTGGRGRIDAALLREHVPDFMERTVYLCGPQPFMEAARTTLEATGFPMDRYFSESFGGVPKKPARRSAHSKIMELWPTPASGSERSAPADEGGAPKARPEEEATPSEPGAPQLVFSQSGHEIEITGDATILEAADEVGVTIPNACRSGVCGTCKVRRISGDIVMDTEAGIEEHEREMGYILACIARCRGRVEIEA